ncbi:MAG: aldo/keto reductase [Lachnospiraceae bacterium]|jgi:predicted aldo/keto reductase-like oxidoreductase|nr:aldo/keto reductase [Lachnospiraceae bacterium]
MQYRSDRYGNQISVLGFGCMRLPRNGAAIDLDESEREIRRAAELGVNYFDSAYIYPGVEAAVGRIMARTGLREHVYLATKLPHYLMRSRGQIESTFAEELSRLQTDHIDYYLMHMLTDIASWEKLRKLGIEDWIAGKKASGQIRQIGFSFHGSCDMFLKILNAYDWDFCQIQYNYIDEYSQAGRRGLEAAAAKGIPVVIMEPLRGGRLVNLLPAEARRVFAENAHHWSPAEWGLRWLYDQSAVTCVLSGMNTMEMVEENVRVASEATAGCLTQDDRDVLEKAKTAINGSLRVACTGCAYCMPCPHGVDIPGTFRCWNEMYAESRSSGRTDYYRSTICRHTPTGASLCVQCGRCEKLCPQQIDIRAKLKGARRELETPWYTISNFMIRLLHLW